MLRQNAAEKHILLHEFYLFIYFCIIKLFCKYKKLESNKNIPSSLDVSAEQMMEMKGENKLVFEIVKSLR